MGLKPRDRLLALKHWSIYRQKEVYSVRGIAEVTGYRKNTIFNNEGKHMTKELSQTGEVLIYQTPDGHTAVDVVLEQDTVWLSLQQMADLFGRDKSVISRHLKNIYETNELDRGATVVKNATVQVEGSRKVQYVRF